MDGEAAGPRIWVDGFPLAHPFGTGITGYTRRLVTTLHASGARTGVLFGRAIGKRRDAQEREVRFFDAMGADGRGLPSRLLRLATEPKGPVATLVPASGLVARGLGPAAMVRQFTTASVPPGTEIWNADDLFGRGWVRLWFTRRLERVRVDGAAPPRVMHWSSVQPLRMPGALNLYTVHDLIPLRLPWAAKEVKRMWLLAARAIAREADHILAVSEHARQDIIAQLGVAPERVTNTYQPVATPEPLAEGARAVERLRAVHGLEPRGYFLFVSTVEPRKNLPRLLDAYYASGSATPLIIVGQKGLNYEEELRLLTHARGDGGLETPDRRVRWLGYIPRLDVDVLLRHARALLFPSLYEGFGLPAAEAMAVGTAVLASATTSLPEVVGEAGLLVDPTDPRAIADGIRALDADAGLRARLEALGPARAALFSPARYARRLSELHARLGVPLEASR